MSMDFAIKCLKTPTKQDIFPLNPTMETHMIGDKEKSKVDKARTESYKNSTIPQQQLNKYFSKANITSRKEARAGRGAADRASVGQ